MRIKNIGLYSLLLALSYLTACTPDDVPTNKCGATTTANLAIANYGSYAQYKVIQGFTEGNTTGYTKYLTYANGRSAIELKLWLRQVCRINPAQIIAQTAFDTLPNGMADTLVILQTDLPSPPLSLAMADTVTTGPGGFFYKTKTNTLGTGTAPTEIIAINRVSFPSQGSWGADSAYFFKHLTNQSIKINCNTVE